MIKRIDRAEGTRWQVYGRRAGRKVYVGTFTTRKQAVAADEEHRVTQRRVRAGELPEQTDDRLTLGAALDRWLEWVAKARPRSLTPYGSNVKNHVRPALGDSPLTKVTARQLEGFYARLAERLGRATIETIRAMLGGAWGWFARQGLVPRGVNPVEDSTLTGIPKRKKPLVNWISNPADVTKLLAACPPSIRTIVHVMIATGVRIDEALHLRWEDVDLERRVLHVRRGRQGAPKSNRERAVDLFDVAIPVLREMRLARGANALLWPSVRRGRDGAERVRNASGVHRPFKAALSRAGLDRKLRVHDMRHTFAGLYLSAGGDIYRLSQLLGHSSVRITEQTYAHLSRGAFEQDRARIQFAAPSDQVADVIAFPGRGRQRGDGTSGGCQ